MGTRATGQRLTIAQAIRHARAYHTSGGSPKWLPMQFDPIDAEILLSHALCRPRAWLLAHGEQTLTLAQVKCFQTLLRQHARGVPLAYLIGEREFYGRTFQVTPDVLIPRPESELLVDLALRWMEWQKGRYCDDVRAVREPPQQILDIGTGSGCLITSLALEIARRGWTDQVSLCASDISTAALTIAKHNAKRLNATGITWHQGSLWKPWRNKKFDLVIANLPYLKPGWYGKDLHHEPKKALVGGKNGLTVYRRLLASAAAHLNPGGAMLLEIDPRQRSAMQTIIHRLLPDAKLTLHRDLAGRWRVADISLTVISDP